MLTAAQKIAILESAIERLHESDALVQQALGATDECYDIHSALEDMADDLQSTIDTLKALAKQRVIL